MVNAYALKNFKTIYFWNTGTLKTLALGINSKVHCLAGQWLFTYFFSLKNLKIHKNMITSEPPEDLPKRDRLMKTPTFNTLYLYYILIILKGYSRLPWQHAPILSVKLKSETRISPLLYSKFHKGCQYLIMIFSRTFSVPHVARTVSCF